MTDEQKAYWAQQIDWAIKTVGVSGVLLAALLYGIYAIAIYTIDTFKPAADRVVNEHIQFLHKQVEIGERNVSIGEKNQSTLQQLVDLNKQTVELVRDTNHRLSKTTTSETRNTP